MDFSKVISLAVLVVAAAAGVVGYFKANLSKATIELYKENNEALTARITTLESQRTEDAAKIKALENANKFLAAVVTQADQIAALTALCTRIGEKVGV